MSSRASSRRSGGRSHWQGLPAHFSEKAVLDTLGESKHFRNPVRMTGFGDAFTDRASGFTGARGNDWANTANSRANQPQSESGWPRSQRQRDHAVMLGHESSKDIGSEVRLARKSDPLT